MTKLILSFFMIKNIIVIILSGNTIITNNYVVFYYVFDYEIIRRALKICIETRKTREKAITSIRKVLRKYERDKNIIVMNVYDTILEMREEIEKYFLD